MNSIPAFLKNKKIIAAIALLLFGLVLVFAFSSSGSSESREGGEESLAEYKERLEDELEKLCSSVEGVGKCSVTVSFSKGAESTYRGSYLVETKPPEVLGVTVVCRGADSVAVRAALTELFTSLFAIPTSRVAILKLNS